MQPSIPKFAQGEVVSASKLNKIARMAAVGASRELQMRGGGFMSSSISGMVNSAETPWIELVELNEDIGPEESSEFRNRGAAILALRNPTSISETPKWYATDHTLGILDAPYFHLPYEEGQRTAAFFHRQSGKYIPLHQPFLRAVRTCRDRDDESSDASLLDYPLESDRPNTYAIEHVKLVYTPQQGRNTLTVTSFDSMDRVSPNPPHGISKDRYVHNLFDGEHSYIPEGTIIWAWMQAGQWFTYCQVTPETSESSMSSGSPGIDFVTDVRCNGSVIEVCTRTVRMPEDWVDPEECPDTSSGV